MVAAWQMAANVAASSAQPPIDLARASLEDLMNIEITSASRREQRASDVPAAVYVITAEEIRRSGLTSLPELLRLAPGTDVAQINANSWAISIRGFNDLWANKLLVLVDGRSIYTRVFSGVDWNMQHVILEDVDRIEIIRGPAASMWGANAVNGVVNIITKPAAETKGLFASAASGRLDPTAATIRYGASVGRTAYRVYGDWSDHAAYLDVLQQPAGDTWRQISAGFRTDWTNGPDTVTTEAGVVNGRAWHLWTSFEGPTSTLSSPAPTSPANDVNPTALIRWRRQFTGGSSLQLQSSGEYRRRRDGNGVEQNDGVFDVDGQVQTRLGPRHEVVVGVGFRHEQTQVHGNLNFSLVPDQADFDRVGWFAQDDIALARQLHATVGIRLDHDERSQASVQPTARLLWQAAHRQHLWVAWSHADRPPAITELSMRVNVAATAGPTGLPVLVGIVGSPDYRTEEFSNVEAGYRINVNDSASFDANVFRGRYDRLMTTEPMAPIVETAPPPTHLFVAGQRANLLAADTAGVELSAHWAPVPAWRVDGSYTALRLSPHLDPMSRDAAAATSDGNAPSQQWQLRSAVWLGRRVESSAGLYYVGGLRELQVPAYTRLDAQVRVTLSPALSLVATGQNLLDRAHAEFAGATMGLAATEIPRSAAVRLEWRRP